MLPSLEIYAKQKEAHFREWFAKYGDCGSLFKLDSYWPQIFKESVDESLSQIINDPFATEASLNQDISDLSKFVHTETLHDLRGTDPQPC